MNKSKLAYEIRKTLIDNGHIQYDHEKNKIIEWLIRDILVIQFMKNDS